MVTSVGSADKGKVDDFPMRGGDDSGRREDRGQSAKGARPEFVGGDRVGGERVEEQLAEGRREGGGALPAAVVVVARSGGGETLTAAAGVGRWGTIERDDCAGEGGRVLSCCSSSVGTGNTLLLSPISVALCPKKMLLLRLSI